MPRVAPGRTAGGVTAASPLRRALSARAETLSVFLLVRAASSPALATAKSAALVAPAAPIARVPTGTPAGICTMDKSESKPLSARLCTGTPSTGTTVPAATIPGRCAAPPAPAMTTSSPRASASSAKARQPRRGAVRRDDQALKRHAKTFQRLGGVPHRLPIGGAAHDDAYQRLDRVILWRVGCKISHTSPWSWLVAARASLSRTASHVSPSGGASTMMRSTPLSSSSRNVA